MITFKDIYTFPFQYYDKDYYNIVEDASGNFIFQFEFYHDPVKAKLLLLAINGKKPLIDTNIKFHTKDGYIYITTNQNEPKPIILIRGWGNLTSLGGYGFSSDVATEVQDSLANYIVKQLNLRE